MEDLLKIDIYELLDISDQAEEKEIKRAYRKKALTCHPDKNPDNPKAAKLFQQLTKSLEILIDAKARSSYDQVRRAKKAAFVRSRQLDSKSKKFKEDLEAREKAAQEARDTKNAEIKLQREIERLRAEGIKIVEQEWELMRQQILKEREEEEKRQKQPIVENGARLKIKWKAKKNDASNAGYTETKLSTILKQFGQVSGLVISKTKMGSAMVEFTHIFSAKAAMKSNVGDPDNPLKLSWVGEEPKTPEAEKSTSSSTAHYSPIPRVPKNLPFEEYEKLVLSNMLEAQRRKEQLQAENIAKSAAETTLEDISSSGSRQEQKTETDVKTVKESKFFAEVFEGIVRPPGSSVTSNYRDYEDVTIMRLRQAEERKRLIEQMAKEDEEIS